MTDKKIKIAVNRSFNEDGKLKPASEGESRWRLFSSSFANEELTVDELVSSILDGASFCAQLFTNWRMDDNFLCGQHVGIDLDELPAGYTLNDLMSNALISRYAAFAYTTPSHAPDKPKMRVVFVLDRPVSKRDSYALLISAVMSKFGEADAACKDVSRFFYGSRGGEALKIGNVLTLEEAAEVFVNPYKALIEEKKQARAAALASSVTVGANDVSAATLERHRTSHLDKIVNAPDGQKHAVLRKTVATLAGYAGGGYYSVEDVRAWCQAAIRQNKGKVASYAQADKTIEDAIAYGIARPLYFEFDQRYATPAIPSQQPPEPEAPPFEEMTPERIQSAIKEAYWKGYHDGMSQAQREQLHLLGFNDQVIDTLKMGWADRQVDEETGEIVRDASLVLPYMDESGNVANIEYSSNGEATYEREDKALYHASRSLGFGGNSRAVLLPSALESVRSALADLFPEWDVIGLSGLGIDKSLAESLDYEEIVVILEKNQQIEGGHLIKGKALFTRLPVSMESMRSIATADDLRMYVKQARVWA